MPRSTYLRGALSLAFLGAYSCNDSDFASSSAESRNDSKPTANEESTTPPSREDDSPELSTDVNTEVIPETQQPEDTSTDTATQDPECGRGKVGFYGKVYELAPNTPKLPDLAAMEPVGRVDTLQLDIPTRDWEAGFPSVEALREWFAVSFQGILEIPEDGLYSFQVNSDDGSNLYINDAKVVDNDGVHSPKMVQSSELSFKKGKYRIKLDWYQGPRNKIALQLFWKTPGSSQFAIIPKENVEHARDCTLKNLGTFP